MNKQELTAMVAEILAQMGREPMVKASDYHPTQPRSTQPDPGFRDGDFVPDITQLNLRKLYLVEDPKQPEQFRHPFHNGTQKRTDTHADAGVCPSRKRVPPINGVYLSSSANQQSIFAISVRTAVPPGLRFVLPRPPFRPAPTVHRIASFALGGNAAAVRERTQISALVSHPL